MDDDWPGAKYRGATWVEFYGGPWDGTMVEEKQVPLQLLGKIKVLPKGSTVDQAGHLPEPLGAYYPVDWADEELRIVKLEWRGGKPKK
jgi:hypothetical protein